MEHFKRHLNSLTDSRKVAYTYRFIKALPKYVPVTTDSRDPDGVKFILKRLGNFYWNTIAHRDRDIKKRFIIELIACSKKFLESFCWEIVEIEWSYERLALLILELEGIRDNDTRIDNLSIGAL